jgi:hypothetical protein
MNGFTVLVCGDRNWDDYKAIERELDKLRTQYGPMLVIIQGGAKGADNHALTFAVDNDVESVTFKADWEKHGKAAGPIRNRKMLKDGEPRLVLAFHKNLSKSKGTLDMIFVANKAGVPIRIYSK